VSDAILVLNAGSSSIKFLLFAVRNGALEAAIRGQIEGLHTAPRFIARNPDGRVLGEKSWGDGVELSHDGALTHLEAFLRSHADGIELTAVGHRVVHGGPVHTQPARLDRDVLAVLEKFVPLAPLHQPHNLAPIRMLLERRPELPQVACFDTAFHSTNPDIARRFADGEVAVEISGAQIAAANPADIPCARIIVVDPAFVVGDAQNPAHRRE